MTCIPSLFIFDMDGVLIDSSEIHEKAFKTALRPFGIESSFDYSKYTGMKTGEALKDFFQTCNISISNDELQKTIKKKQEVAQYLHKKSYPLDPSSIKVLIKLKPYSKIAIASSASKNSVNLLIEHLSGSITIDFSVSGDDVEKSKPDPEIFQRCLDYFKVAAHDAVVIEDSPNGILAAKRCGIPSVGVIGSHPKEELLTTSVERTIYDLDELLDIYDTTNLRP